MGCSTQGDSLEWKSKTKQNTHLYMSVEATPDDMWALRGYALLQFWLSLNNKTVQKYSDEG